MNTDTNSIGFKSLIKQTGKTLKPYLKYDTLKHTLNFLYVYCNQDDGNNECTHPFLSIESGTYLYKDTAFVMSNDTSYYFPALKELDETVDRQIYKAGKYIIRAKIIEGYEEQYGGAVGVTVTKEYQIGKQTLTAFNDDEFEPGKIDLKPDYHLLKNGALILLLEDQTNGHGPGMCGSGSHYDSSFWLVDNKSSKELFSFSTSACDSYVRYNFMLNKKEISGSLFVTKPYDEYELDSAYWKDNSTYVFIVSNDEKSLARKFYVHFNITDKKNSVKLETGKLYKTKRGKSNKQ
jgi:hypothetical protein